MAFPLNQLGPYQFIRIDGIPQLLREELERIERPGVEGTGFLKIGQRSKPFDIATKIDAMNWAAAHSANVLYHTLVGQPPVDLIHAGINYSVASIRFVVLDVKVNELTPVAVPIGGINGGYVIVSATWTLQAIRI